MKHITKAALAGVASLASVAAFAVPAHADNNAIQINRVAHLTPTHLRVLVGVRVECSEDTTSAALAVTLTEVTGGNVQTAVGTVTDIGSFECSGSEETVWIPVRRPTGGFRWDAGAARASNLVFVTADPSGVFTSTLKGRTIVVR